MTGNRMCSVTTGEHICTTMQDTRTFAAGRYVWNESDAPGCPAYTAFESTDEINDRLSLRQVEGRKNRFKIVVDGTQIVKLSFEVLFDEYLDQVYSDSIEEKKYGAMIPENVARTAWIELIQIVEEQCPDTPEIERVLDNARDVATELGWSEEMSQTCDTTVVLCRGD